jgi:hypothetical protein
MLYAPEPLLLRGCNQHAIARERSRRICVKGIEAKDDHLDVLSPT